MTTIGGMMGSGQSASVSDTAPAAHTHTHRCGHAPCFKVYRYTDKTAHTFDLVLTANSQ